MYQGLDHIAIAVEDTEAALEIWHKRFGFPVLFSEKVNDETVLLTHLDLGNTHLQLVEPLVEGHPLQEWLKANGSGLHHFCLKVENVSESFEAAKSSELPPGQPQPHQGTQGKRAMFLDAANTDGVRVELTGP